LVFLEELVEVPDLVFGEVGAKFVCKLLFEVVVFFDGVGRTKPFVVSRSRGELLDYFEWGGEDLMKDDLGDSVTFVDVVGLSFVGVPQECLDGSSVVPVDRSSSDDEALLGEGAAALDFSIVSFWDFHS
jgi:hypothetical protein